MWRSFSVSPSSSRPAGMPVHDEMTSAMSSLPTSLLDHDIGARGRTFVAGRGLELPSREGIWP